MVEITRRTSLLKYKVIKRDDKMTQGLVTKERLEVIKEKRISPN